MSKLSDKTAWMTADDYGRSLSGLSVNLLVKDVTRSLEFHREVLGATELYSDVDFAAFEFSQAGWMLHADHTYDAHPLHSTLKTGQTRGIGAEIRLHGRDPDGAQAEAERLGYQVLQEATDKPHGVREVFLVDPDGYLWVPDIPLVPGD